MGNPNPKLPPVETRFKKGSSGNPNGRPKGKSLTSTILETLDKKSNPKDPKSRTWRTEIVTALLAQAAAGNAQALNLIFERCDGKVPQALTGRNNGPIEIVMVNE